MTSSRNDSALRMGSMPRYCDLAVSAYAHGYYDRVLDVANRVPESMSKTQAKTYSHQICVIFKKAIPAASRIGLQELRELFYKYENVLTRTEHPINSFFDDAVKYNLRDCNKYKGCLDNIIIMAHEAGSLDWVLSAMDDMNYFRTDPIDGILENVEDQRAMDAVVEAMMQDEDLKEYIPEI